MDILQTGLSGLLAFRRALTTSAHNVANVNTPNFSRQRVDLSAAAPQLSGNSYFGSGVNVANVSRIYDEFLTTQIRQHQAGFSQTETLDGLLAQVNGLLGDQGTGLPTAMQGFFAAVQDVADDPTSLSTRQAMLSKAQSLAARFQNTSHQLDQLRLNVNRGLETTVAELNQLAEAIAVLNEEIASQGKSAGQPNDLMDRRDHLLADLSKLVSVQTAAQDDGSINVFIGSGQPLVVGDRVTLLEVAPSVVDSRNVEIRQQGQIQGGDLSRQLTGGRLGGYLTFRQEMLEPVQSSIGLIAIGLAETFNAQHHKGMDIEGDLGGDFFRAGTPRQLANANNGGDAILDISIDNVDQLQQSDYELSYDGSNYHLRRLADDTIVASAASGPFNVDGLTIDVASGTSVAGDRILIQPTRDGASGFAVSIARPADIAVALPVIASTSQDNLGSAEVSALTVVDEGNPDLGRTVEIRFTSATEFDVIDTATGTALATGQSYSSGSPITFNGWELSISGAAQAGDVFEVSDNAGGVADNRNALALADLQIAPTLLGGTSSYHDVYSQLATDLGSQASNNRSTLATQSALLNRATDARDSVSGVNLDEEAADLVRFQQAYEASARLIQTAQTLFDTLLGAVRR